VEIAGENCRYLEKTRDKRAEKGGGLEKKKKNCLKANRRVQKIDKEALTTKEEGKGVRKENPDLVREGEEE